MKGERRGRFEKRRCMRRRVRGDPWKCFFSHWVWVLVYFGVVSAGPLFLFACGFSPLLIIRRNPLA